MTTTNQISEVIFILTKSVTFALKVLQMPCFIFPGMADTFIPLLVIFLI